MNQKICASWYDSVSYTYSINYEIFLSKIYNTNLANFRLTSVYKNMGDEEIKYFLRKQSEKSRMWATNELVI